MPLDMLVTYTNECRWKVRTLIEDHNCIQSRSIKACTSGFLSDHVIKSLATNPDILVRAVKDQMQKQFDDEVLKMKAFRAKRIATDRMTGSYREQYSLLREYAQELINQNPGTTVRIDVQQEPNPESLTRIFKRVSNKKRYSFNPILNLNCPHGLIQVIASVFPSAGHRYCVRHIHENMKSQFKGGVYNEMLWNAAKATSDGEFNKKMGELIIQL
ncbi:hypothetical protein Tco_0842046 [Tanacetum coccineum]|uniref:MULE transposase domain-containing protein n=1 Tax=Tanacetum coccineum TaxID=301880 RepID=A0ABQ5B3T0_9ASTR